MRVRKYRQRERAFLVEGDDLVAAGLAAGLRPRRYSWSPRRPRLAARLAQFGHALADAPVYPVDERVAAKLSTLETPASTMAIFAIPEPPALGELRSRDAPASRAIAGARRRVERSAGADR